MAKKSIANRWLINGFGVMVVVMIVINLAAYYLIRSYYYGAVSAHIQSQANIIAGLLERSYDDPSVNFTQEVRQLVENFDKRESIELMAINKSGRVALTSSGFTLSSDYNMPDYQQAIATNQTMVEHTGPVDGSQNIIAVTVLIQHPNSNYSAVRLVSALDRMDSHINTSVLTIAAVSIGVILIVFLSGIYFLKSIIIPLRQISATARKLAIGDFTVRIAADNDDEIGELCRVFNHMADELENAETIKNDFISSVSHELRTPLTAIKGWSETLVDVNDEATLKKGMNVIAGETQRLSVMVEELLDFSRIQSGRFTLEKTSMDLLAELGEVALIYEEKARRDGINIIYNEPDDMAIIYGDKNRIKQVFINIIDNAIKYTDPGGNVAIDAIITEETITIVVSDTGIGIAAEDLPKIKTKFYKANSTRRGSGIGLAVADEIIQLHGGTMDIDSQKDVGTTVSISLPRAKKHDRIEKIEKAEPKVEPIERTDLFEQ